MVNISDQFTDEIHLDEWKQYETKLLKKHEGNAFQPDRLYQEYKKKNLLMQTMMKMRQQTKEKENVETPVTTIPLSHPHPHHR